MHTRLQWSSIGRLNMWQTNHRVSCGEWDGHAGVSSSVGHGSRFWFSAALTLGRGAVVEGSRFNMSDPFEVLKERCTGNSVLVVEDNVVNREVIIAMLEGSGLVVECAVDGVDGLERASSKQFDLILMDVQMPGLDGLEATRLIRCLPGWEGKPILAMTANVFTDDREACKDAGMNDFVAKPIDPDEVYRLLTKWLPVRRSGTEIQSSDGGRNRTNLQFLQNFKAKFKRIWRQLLTSATHFNTLFFDLINHHK